MWISPLLQKATFQLIVNLQNRYILFPFRYIDESAQNIKFLWDGKSMPLSILIIAILLQSRTISRVTRVAWWTIESRAAEMGVFDRVAVRVPTFIILEVRPGLTRFWSFASVRGPFRRLLFAPIGHSRPTCYIDSFCSIH